MRFCTIKTDDNREEAAVRINDGLLLVSEFNRLAETNFPTNTLELINVNLCQQLDALLQEFKPEPTINLEAAKFAPPYRNPPKIWGIGMNYKNAAKFINAVMPPEPNLFMKPNTAIIGCKENIVLPAQSKRVIAEAELGVIIGKRCKFMDETEAAEAIFGFTNLFDMVAEDILQVNPRFLARSKSFDTFLPFGPWIVTKDEVDDIRNIAISCNLNDEEVISDVVSNMTYSPAYTVAFLSNVLTLEPGDIICTGTPRPVVINPGDKVECVIDGVGRLVNYVVASTIKNKL